MKKNCDLGILLIEFFQLFGKTFNYDTTGISKNSEFFQKDNANPGTYNQTQLTIEDPHDPGLHYSEQIGVNFFFFFHSNSLENDVGRGSFRILYIKNTFEQAYEKLFYGIPQTLFPTKLTRILESDQHLVSCREHYLHTYQRLVR